MDLTRNSFGDHNEQSFSYLLRYFHLSGGLPDHSQIWISGSLKRFPSFLFLIILRYIYLPCISKEFLLSPMEHAIIQLYFPQQRTPQYASESPFGTMRVASLGKSIRFDLQRIISSTPIVLKLPHCLTKPFMCRTKRYSSCYYQPEKQETF